MRNLKRGLCLLLVLVLAGSFMPGCQNQSTETSQPQSTANDQVQTAVSSAQTQEAATVEAQPGQVQLPLAKEKKTLSLWTQFSPMISQYITDFNENPTFQKAEELTNVHIKFVQVSPEASKENYNLMVASGQLTDFICNDMTVMSYGGDKAIADETVVNLEDYKQYMPNLFKYVNMNDATRKQLYTDSGKLAICANFSVNATPSTQAGFGSMIRQDWLDKVGLSAPVTYDDYYKTLKAFKEKLGVDGPMMMLSNCVPMNNFLIGGYGVKGYLSVGFMPEYPFYQVDGKVKFGLIESGFKDYITMMAKWYSEGLINKDLILSNQGWGSPDMVKPVITDKVGLWFGDRFKMPLYKMQAKDTNFKVVAAPDPVKNPGDKIHFGGFSDKLAAEMGGAINGISISGQCSDPVLAAKWIDFWYGEQGSLLANFGVEGSTFNFDGNKKPVYTDMITKNPKKMDSMAAKFVYLNMVGTTATDASLTTVFSGEDEKNAGVIWMGNKDTTWELEGTMTNEEGSEYTQLIGDISTYAGEMVLKMVMGQEPITKFDEFVKRIKDMDIDKCIQLKQAAYDRYKAR